MRFLSTAVKSPLHIGSEDKMGTKKGIIFILVAGILWGTIGIFVRSLNALGLEAMQLVFIRALITAVVLLVGVLIYDRKLLKIKLRDLWCFIGTAILSILFFYYFYFVTIEKASLAVAAVLLYTAPIFVMLMSLVLFKEKLTGKKITACAVAFAGCALVAGIFDGGGNVLSPAALLTGLLSGFGYALYSIFSRFALNKGYSSVTITVYTFVIALLCLLPFADYDVIGAAIAAKPDTVVFASLGLSIFVTVIPYLLYTAGLSTVNSSKASIMASVEPVMACVVSVAVFHESMSFFGAVGIVLVIAAIILLNLQPHRGKGDIN